VRRDLLVAGVAGAVAVVAFVLLGASAVGLVPERGAATAIVAAAAVVFAVCLFAWGTGPTNLSRDRAIVLTPMLLIAAPGVVALHQLGGGPVVVMLSGAAGAAAAIVGGLLLASRRG
jgi:hypothetical protein